MDFTISLAHFCEIHGPTSIICTQASPSPCTTCNPCVTPPSEEGFNSLYNQPSLNFSGRLASPFDTPPTSPRSPTHNPYFPSFPSSDGAFTSRRPSSTYDSEPDVCANCSIVVPKKYTEKLSTGGLSSPTKQKRGRNGSPVLRTSQNVPVRSTSDSFSSSPESDVSDNEQSKSFGSCQSYGSIPASPMYESRGMHTHTLNYISTSQPQSPQTYSLLRRTCIRTLSCEALPCGKPSGPLMFGDPVAGYTIAYIFRLQDPDSRGAKRTYALIAMAGRDCRRASKAMVKVTEVFEGIANRIVTSAERVRAKESLSSVSTTPFHPSMSSLPTSTSPQHPRLVSSVASSPTTRNIMPVSSFLAAKKVDPDGYPRGSRLSREASQAKTLTELVGNENFFVELHSWFCHLLQYLIKEFGS
ncbi:hypothetical protein M011DRAFT_458407 [Sporormia fimetaria CBS 119925]|uniref:UDENN FLCN/SMCR8-type domain-containing protein n=1 Tax=Sporormia fimetaria CBS 119925 TaxID=1340428 RepID=A0A6A6VD92_9PLEO|nr:hypothetical protein M011DRAFT_458407 [Sporormia fimetaria CBS 119925]